MNERIEFLNRTIKPLCQGAKVLDFCCGTGMNGVYALEHGAEFVHFTDVRSQLFQAYTENLKLDENHFSWSFLDADSIEHKNLNHNDIDIIIYHGHLYHARNHYQILKLLTESSAKYICFESKGQHNDRADITWSIEPQDIATNSLEASQQNLNSMVGAPTSTWCSLMFRHFGWEIADSTLEHPQDKDYAKWRYWLKR
jgi:16S rRNA G966 N2-methylase RsmD|tara:strand:- start:742 stop:1335 length:594 start_codon:yes stop_codon:yes gene_type:complete